ncbi:hypothetical protein I3842_04G131800 [Carya illinoinensis]|uniref:Uncharacterized protein n=1 Tax=Carya illinoinensis TaxID=32201 RepID=A0A922F9U3_CARIL|nr:hypothetical protein I3842_04G131800 [Carya illinoinensis]
MLATNFNTRRPLDNGSLVDILFKEEFAKEEINQSWMRLLPTPLKGFLGETIQPIGSITLPVTVKLGTYTDTNMTNFLVVKTRSSYKAIIGQQTLNSMSTLTSMYHLKMKFQWKQK